MRSLRSTQPPTWNGSWRHERRRSAGQSGLRLHMRDDSRLALLWVPIDDVTPLRNRLPEVLGERLQAG